MPPPIGPKVDATPCALPARVPIQGRYVVLEPLHVRHAEALWDAAQGADDSWAYLGYGPFASVQAMARFVGDFAAEQEHVAWAVRPLDSGIVSGWLTLMNIQPKNAAIELGNIWFAPCMQRTRATTEAMFLPLRLAADELGYRRLVWKCNALNAPSKRAAERLGFVYEGQHRMHQVIKERQRDTDWYSIVGDEWAPRCRALTAWLDPANFGPDGVALKRVTELRGA